MSETVIDATGQCLVGSGRAELLEAAKDPGDRSGELAQRLASLMPVAGYRVVFTDSGSSAMAAAAALVRSGGEGLVIADERISGLGRSGEWFAFGQAVPDLVVLGEALTSGYAPVGAVLIAPHLDAPGFEAAVVEGGGVASSSAALANLDVIEREGLVARAAEQQLTLAAALTPVRSHALVASVRTGPGLMAVVEFTSAVARRVAAEGLTGRVLVTLLSDASLVIAPPLVIDRAGLQRIGSALDEALTALGSKRPSGSAVDVTLLPDITGDEQGGFGSRDAELLADVPPHHGS